MKKILGLDIGTTSIGWAYVHEADNEQEQSRIIDLGVRVNPLTVDEQNDFIKGKPITTNAARRLKRGMRRNLQRYKLRRRHLIEKLLEHRIINKDTILYEQGSSTTHETLRLRAQAASERIELDQLARVLLSINRKRGYRSSRKDVSSNGDKAINGMQVALELYNDNLTPGQWLYQHLKAGTLKGMPDFYRSDLCKELECIWQKQQTYYPEVLSPDLYESIQGKGHKDTAQILYKHSKIETAKNEGKRQEKLHRILRWRAEATQQQMPLAEVWTVVCELNKLISQSSGYLGAISDRSKTLAFANQTVGQYQYAQILKNRHTSLRNQVFYRLDYLNEFEQIWEIQKQFHPELSDILKTELRDIVIFYQRKLRSQKGLINICEFEQKEIEVKHNDSTERKCIEKKQNKIVGLRVVPRSSPLFQEFKIWQVLGNILRRPKGSLKRKLNEESNVYALSLDEKQRLFFELNIKGRLSAEKALKILKYSSKEWEMNYKELEGNATNAALYKAYLQICEEEGCDLEKSLNLKKENWSMSDIEKPATEIIELVHQHFEMLGIDTGLLRFDALAQGKSFYQQSSYALWHLLYSYEEDNSPTGNDKLHRLLIQKYGFQSSHCEKLDKVPLLQDYGNLSAKAIRKILPYMAEYTYSEACSHAGYKHSKRSLTKEEIATRPLLDKLSILPKGSLRQPVVEKILNQLINLVNTLIDKYSLKDQEGNIIEVFRFDEIRIELARELKNNAKERAELTKRNNEGEKENKKIVEALQNEFGIANPSHNDIIRYRLYLELQGNGYRDLYHNKYISKEQLFSKEIDIEHIIPQARLFDDSFSNKTLTYRSDNLKKGNRTAFDYISEDFSNSLEQYQARITDLKTRNVISALKADKLLKSARDIGDGFIERDLRTTQYISRKAQEILLTISRRVLATSGKITSRLREDWGLINVMKEINLEKYRRLGHTEYIERRSGAKIEVIKDWTKRDDHRHHAMDALTIAFTKPSYIQYLNHLNARYDDENSEIQANILGIQKRETISKLENDGQSRKVFREPMPNFRREARLYLERILTSHKSKNKATTRSRNKLRGTNKVQITLTPRGELHKETIYGKRRWLNEKPRPLNKKFTLEQVTLIAQPAIRKAVEEHIAQYPSIEIALDSKTLKKTPILYKGEVLSEVLCFDEIYTIRKDISPDLKIEDVLDEGVKQTLRTRLKEYNDDPKKAFSNLEENPIWLNPSQGICLKRVTIKARPTNLEALHNKKDKNGELCLDPKGNSIPTDYVLNGSNHHIAIYSDNNDKLQERVVSFMEAVARTNAGLPVIDKDYNKDLGWKFLFTLKQNEMFVFPNPQTGFDPLDIDLLDPNNKSLISPNLYRVQKVSSHDYYFRHHLETSVTRDLKDVTFKRLQTTNSLSGCIKVRLDHLGDIIQIGEY